MATKNKKKPGPKPAVHFPINSKTVARLRDVLQLRQMAQMRGQQLQDELQVISRELRQRDLEIEAALAETVKGFGYDPAKYELNLAGDCSEVVAIEKPQPQKPKK